MKKCTLCKKDIDFSGFHKKKGSKDGYQSRCKDCAIKRAKNHYGQYSGEFKDRSKILIIAHRNVGDIIKTKYKCFNCGISDARCLDFHHIDPTQKDINVSALLSSKTKKNIIEEINKCIVTCANCHRLIHYGVVQVNLNKRCVETQEEFEKILIAEKNKLGINTKIKRPRKNYKHNKCACGKIIDKLANSCMNCKPSKLDMISKEDLSKLVWEKTTQELAKELDVSDVLIGKKCKKLGIAKPPRGYWQKLKSCKK